MKKSSTERLDALYNNPIRKKISSTLKKHKYRKLSDLVKKQEQTKIQPSAYYELVDLEQIDGITGRIISMQEVAKLGSNKILLKANSIVVAKLQPDNGKIAIVNQEFDGVVGSSELIPIVLDSDELSLQFLWVILRSKLVLNQWKYLLTGSSRMRIGWTELENTVILVPDKSIQNEIVDKISDIISRHDEKLDEAEAHIKNARNEFASSVLHRT